MDSKTAKTLDRALVKLEKEFERFNKVCADIRAHIAGDLQKHYGKKKGGK